MRTTLSPTLKTETEFRAAHLRRGCGTCLYADRAKVGHGECCHRAGREQLDPATGVCMAWRTAQGKRGDQ